MDNMVGVMIAATAAVIVFGIWAAQQVDTAVRLSAAREVRVYEQLHDAVHRYMATHGADARECLASNNVNDAYGLGSARHVDTTDAESLLIAGAVSAAVDGDDPSTPHTGLGDDGQVAGPGHWVQLPIFQRQAESGDYVATRASMGARGNCASLLSLSQAGLLPVPLRDLFYDADGSEPPVYGPRRARFRWFMRLVGRPADGASASSGLVYGLESLIVAAGDYEARYAAAMHQATTYPGFGSNAPALHPVDDCPVTAAEQLNVVGTRGAWLLRGVPLASAADADCSTDVAERVGQLGTHNFQASYLPTRTAATATGGSILRGVLSDALADGGSGPGTVMALLVAQDARFDDDLVLHRYDTGVPEANTMRTALDLGGFGAYNASYVAGVDTNADGTLDRAPRIVGGAAEAGMVGADGTLANVAAADFDGTAAWAADATTVVGDLVVTGSVRVGGTLASQAQAQFAGARVLGAARVAGDLDVDGDLDLDGDLDAQAAAGGGHRLRAPGALLLVRDDPADNDAGEVVVSIGGDDTTSLMDDAPLTSGASGADVLSGLWLKFGGASGDARGSQAALFARDRLIAAVTKGAVQADGTLAVTEATVPRAGLFAGFEPHDPAQPTAATVHMTAVSGQTVDRDARVAGDVEAGELHTDLVTNPGVSVVVRSAVAGRGEAQRSQYDRVVALAPEQGPYDAAMTGLGVASTGETVPRMGGVVALPQSETYLVDADRAMAGLHSALYRQAPRSAPPAPPPRNLTAALGPYSLGGLAHRSARYERRCFEALTGRPANYPADGPVIESGDATYYYVTTAGCDALTDGSTAHAAHEAGLAAAFTAAYAGYADAARRVGRSPDAITCETFGGVMRDVAVPTGWARPSVSGFGTVSAAVPTATGLQREEFEVPLPYLGWVTHPVTGVDVGGDFERIAADDPVFAQATIMRFCDWSTTGSHPLDG